MRINLSTKGVTRTLAVVTAVLVVLHLVLQTLKWAGGYDSVLGLCPIFDLNNEFNIPTLYTFLLMLMSSLLAAVITYHARLTGQPFYAQWAGLSVVFSLVAVDEILEIHEKWSVPLREHFGFTGFFYDAWMIPYAALGAVLLLLLYFRFFIRIVCNQRLMLLALGFYLSGVLILESFGGWYRSSTGEDGDIIFMMFTTVEEILEMAGLVIFIHALLDYINKTVKEIVINWV